jgi:flagella basal body P-ring formation protein FlgA
VPKNLTVCFYLFLCNFGRVKEGALLKSGKSMPVVECGLIGHTRRMNVSYDAKIASTGLNPVIERLRWFWQGRGPGWLTLIALGSLIIAPWGYAETDQGAIKEDATKQIQDAAAQAFYTDPANVEVRLADKRLVLPDCSQPFDVKFPFSDRATAQLDCVSPKWRGFIQIRLREGVTAFRYNLPLNKGESLKRSHVTRHAVAPGDAISNRIVVLEDVLDLTLREPVQAGDIILESHFMATPISGFAADTSQDVGAWVATKIIPRGNRLHKDTFSWEIVEGRAPTDLIHSGADFAMLEALRDIMPGDKLRRSAVKMAPAVRKDEEIQVSIVRGALTVTNLVRISRDATIGESIDVVNVESGRPLKARVTGIGQVEIL